MGDTKQKQRGNKPNKEKQQKQENQENEDLQENSDDYGDGDSIIVDMARESTRGGMVTVVLCFTGLLFALIVTVHKLNKQLEALKQENMEIIEGLEADLSRARTVGELALDENAHKVETLLEDLDKMKVDLKNAVDSEYHHKINLREAVNKLVSVEQEVEFQVDKVSRLKTENEDLETQLSTLRKESEERNEELQVLQESLKKSEELRESMGNTDNRIRQAENMAAEFQMKADENFKLAQRIELRAIRAENSLEEQNKLIQELTVKIQQLEENEQDGGR